MWVIKLVTKAGIKYIVYAELGLLAKDDITILYRKMCDFIGWKPDEPQEEMNEVTCSNCNGKFPLRENFCPYCGKKNSVKSRLIKLEN